MSTCLMYWCYTAPGEKWSGKWLYVREDESEGMIVWLCGQDHGEPMLRSSALTTERTLETIDEIIGIPGWTVELQDELPPIIQVDSHGIPICEHPGRATGTDRCSRCGEVYWPRELVYEMYRRYRSDTEIRSYLLWLEQTIPPSGPRFWKHDEIDLLRSFLAMRGAAPVAQKSRDLSPPREALYDTLKVYGWMLRALQLLWFVIGSYTWRFTNDYVQMRMEMGVSVFFCIAVFVSRWWVKRYEQERAS